MRKVQKRFINSLLKYYFSTFFSFFKKCPCPVDIIEFGGDSIDVKILESYPKDYIQEKKQRCWPAGHATMGFSLMSLYFLFKKPRNQKIALAFGLTVGVLTGGI
ncbi:phosphatase PAP2 family protein [Aliarcobacter cryaerophilus]|uniref:phosphatase PAP2 family protein n=1 Tax=Aliarcobacter cryaerophilus TaxID=28198 RepID=UPI003DA6573E